MNETLEFDYSSKTSRLQKNISNTLKDNLRHSGIISEDHIDNVAHELMKVHGMAPANFDFVKNVEMSMSAQFKQDTVAGMVDDNSNKTEKTIKQIFADAQASFQKITGYDYLYRAMKELYGKEEAKRLSGLLYSFDLTISDSTQILSVYCYAADFSKLIIEGRPWGVLHSAPAKRVDSYIQQVLETVHEMSNSLAGAIAISTLFFDIAHLIMYADGVNTSIGKVNLEDIKTNYIVRKTLENLFQTIIHSVNHTSRNGAESPFTNISIFDRTKIKGIYGTMEHMFMDTEYLHGDVKVNYIADLIIELQNIYMNIFEKGDQTKNNRQITFPVSTINMTKVFDEESGKFHVVEQDFLKKIAVREMYRYNINVSAGNRVSMCCRFSNDYDLLKSLMREQAKSVNSFGGEGIGIGSHRVVPINLNRVALQSKSVKDFEEVLRNRVEDACKVLKAHKELIKFTADKKLQKFISNGWINHNALFSTIGIMASSEMATTLVHKFGNDEDLDFIGIALDIIESSVDEFSSKYEIFGNIEEIPGESMAAKFPKADRAIFGNDVVPNVLYSNQFVPLWEDATIYERMATDGKYQQKLTGGGIVHFQIGSLLTPLQNENLVNDAVEVGCEHFSANPVTCECENGHNTIGDFNTTSCTKCGAEIVSRITRVVGFPTKVENWNKERREWEAPRRVTYSGDNHVKRSIS